jgi:cellulose biosynthesis protein BcsQ
LTFSVFLSDGHGRTFIRKGRKVTMQSIGVFHTKGGVGKSAVTVFLADFLASLHDVRVLVVDLDPQGSSARALIPEEQLIAAFGQGRSLTKVLSACYRGRLTKKLVESSVVWRTATAKPRRGSVPLADVAVLATEPKGYRTLTDLLHDVSKTERRKHLGMLRAALDLLADEFDVVLIDFPGSELPFWTLMGLRATDRWLLPEIPDYFSAAAIDMVCETVARARHVTGHDVQPLGTLLTICPNRSSTVYKKTRTALTHLEKINAIPRLFSKDCEILHRPDAQKAIDWQSETLPTLSRRYGSSTAPFHVGLRKLAKEVLERLGATSKKDELSFVADLRRRLTDYWR